MKKTSALPILIDLSKTTADQAARELQTLVKARADAGSQLEMLQSYRQDYALRMQQAGASGMSASNYHNFRRFISTLDEAIAQQNRSIQQLESRLDGQRSNWLSEKRRLNSYETLQERYRNQQQIIENRNEQRRNDEASINLYHRARLQAEKSQP
ncbi:flagellar export protein FliJ [Paracandidimonas soli]|uniref:Flagellar FliJ protein n=1 Tax=Paracandidimonas soli TaxID=1917182 RepID=A0A4R3VDM6_9BURK|nr:flagellar export protein FliJ [Paracandidimonas soli]TCV00825.1 flagellar FliJ protein [Paracandidimonas soli]